MFAWPCIVTNFFIIKPTWCTNFTNLFWHGTLHVSDSSSVHHQEFFRCTLSNGICHTGCRQFSFLVLLESSLQPVWHIPLLSVQRINSWWWTEKLSETCRVTRQNKFVKLVHLFIRKKHTIPATTAVEGLSLLVTATYMERREKKSGSQIF